MFVKHLATDPQFDLEERTPRQSSVTIKVCRTLRAGFSTPLSAVLPCSVTTEVRRLFAWQNTNCSTHEPHDASNEETKGNTEFMQVHRRCTAFIRLGCTRVYPNYSGLTL
jgi:hypothetical protein